MSSKSRIGSHSRFNSIINYLCQDTTLQKAILFKEKQDLEFRQLSIKQKLLHQQNTVRNNAYERRELQEKWDELKKSKISDYKLMKVIENSAATTIQRHVRGFLARMHTEQDFIDLYDAKAFRLIREASQQALTIMLNLGVILVPATIVIQKAYKRYLVRKKIYRLRLCYENYLNDMVERANKKIRKGLRMFANIAIVKEKRFLKYRERKLRRIKRNLAILKIKEYWKARRLSFKVIKERIQRLKRRQAALINKEAYAKYLNTLGGKIEKKIVRPTTNSDSEGESDSSKPEVNPPDFMDEEDFLEAQRIKEMIQKKIQEKINKAKLSHGITEIPKPAMVLPLMQEKALKESPSEEIGKLMQLTASVFAKGRAVTRDSKAPSRSTIIGSPPSVQHKRLYSNFELPYMRALFTPEPEKSHFSPPKNIDYAEFMEETVCSARKKRRHYRIQPKKDIPSIPMSSNLIVPTIAYTMKQNTKKQLEKKQNWSFVSKQEKYIPSVSNQAYTPIPWKPLPLNKNILANTEYAKGFYKAKQALKYNIVNFNNRMLTPDLPMISRRSVEHSAISDKEIKYFIKD